jgi:chromosome segregation ATPase
MLICLASAIGVYKSESKAKTPTKASLMASYPTAALENLNKDLDALRKATQAERDGVDKFISDLNYEMKTRLEEKDKRIAILGDEKKAMQDEMKTRLEEKDKRIASLEDEIEKCRKEADGLTMEKMASLLDEKLRAHFGSKKRKFDDDNSSPS